MWRADCSRVTHPFAARVPQRALPLDLHVLSTPPAFVLSQDQTLQQKPSEQSSQHNSKKPHDTTTKKATVPTRTNTPNISALLSSQRTTTPPHQPTPQGRPSGGQLLRPRCPRRAGTTPSLATTSNSTRAGHGRSHGGSI